MSRELLLWQIRDLFSQVARFKLWWATHDGAGEIGRGQDR